MLERFFFGDFDLRRGMHMVLLCFGCEVRIRGVLHEQRHTAYLSGWLLLAILKLVALISLNHLKIAQEVRNLAVKRLSA